MLGLHNCLLFFYTNEANKYFYDFSWYFQILKPSQSQPKTLKDTQRHSKTLKDTQRHSKTLKDSQSPPTVSWWSALLLFIPKLMVPVSKLIKQWFSLFAFMLNATNKAGPEHYLGYISTLYQLSTNLWDTLLEMSICTPGRYADKRKLCQWPYIISYQTSICINTRFS